MALQLGFAAFPEGGAVVEVKGDACAVFLGGAGQLEAELAGVGGEGGDQAGQVDDLDAFFAEDAVQVEVFDVEGAADFAGAVVVDARAA